jgi:hypothetical protein
MRVSVCGSALKILLDYTLSTSSYQTRCITNSYLDSFCGSSYGGNLRILRGTTIAFPDSAKLLECVALMEDGVHMTARSHLMRRRELVPNRDIQRGSDLDRGSYLETVTGSRS